MLVEGRQYESAALSAPERHLVLGAMDDARRLKPFEYQQCYANAQWLVQIAGTGSLEYVEGYVLPRGLGPVQHGWATVNGKVIDPTVVRTGFDLSSEPEQVLGEFDDREYYGVVIPQKVVRARYGIGKGWGPLIDDWEKGWPLLRDGLRVDRARK